MTVAEVLACASRRLATRSDSPHLDAEILMATHLGIPRSGLFTRMDQPLDETQQAAYEHHIDRRAEGEPVAYLTGRKGFWTLDLNVSPAVLVPRPETELLVEWALQIVPVEGLIADLGTGSGAIALSIASERPLARVLATDISAAALEVARANAASCHLDNVQFESADWYSGISGQFDLLVSNPPYIAAGDPHLPHLKHEPLGALSDGADGLSCIRQIVAGAPAHLKRKGWMLVEHGYDQASAVRRLFEEAGFTAVQTRRDLAGHERVTGACLT